MMSIFSYMLDEDMEIFIDDFLGFENSFDQCLEILEKVLRRCESTNLVLNWETLTSL